ASSTAVSASSSVKDRPVFLRGIGPRGRSDSFFFAFALPPRCGLASGPKLRLRAGAGAPVGSNGRGGPPYDDGGRGPNPPGRGPDGGPPGPRSSRARASLTASGRPLN